MSTFVCGTCREPVRDVYDRFEKRIEYRGKPNDNRYRVILLGYLCRTCVDKEVEQHRPPPDWEQSEMFG